jgi:hypothetical protein
MTPPALARSRHLLADPDAERVVLAAMIAPELSYLAIRCTVDADDFSLAGHRTLFRIACEVHRRFAGLLFHPRLPLVIASVCARRIKGFSELGGVQWLCDILAASQEGDPIAAARRVRTLSILRGTRRELHEFERFYLQGYDNALSILYAERATGPPESERRRPPLARAAELSTKSHRTTSESNAHRTAGFSHARKKSPHEAA